MSNQMYQPGTSPNPSYSGQMYCSTNPSITPNGNSRFPYQQSNVQRPDYPNKPGMGQPGSQRYPSYPNQPHQSHPVYPNAQLNSRHPGLQPQAPYPGGHQQYNQYEHMSSFNGPNQPHINQPDKISPRVPQSRGHSSDKQWNFQAPPLIATNHSSVSNLTSPHELQQRSAYPHPGRRPSNTPGECFPAVPPRHLSGQSIGSGNNRSPMMQSSPAGVVSHSPFAGSAGSSLRSPMSNLMGNSPANMPQGQTTSPSQVSMPHLASSPITSNVAAPQIPHPSGSNPSGGSSDPAFQRNMQTYRPWHEQQDPNARTLGSITYQAHVTQTPAPSDAYVQKLDPMGQSSISPASNHFLAPPGSSPSLPAHKHTPNTQNGSVSHGNQRFHGDLAFAAARSQRMVAEADQVGRADERGRFDAQKTFSETMNSVLYGQSDPAKPNPLLGEIKTASSPTDPQSTISPGESGYDSADLISTVDSQRNMYDGTIQQRPSANTDLQQAKNLHAASAGLTHQQGSEFEQPSSSAAPTNVHCTKTEGCNTNSNLLPAEAAVTSRCSTSSIISNEARSHNLPQLQATTCNGGPIHTSLRRAFTAPNFSSRRSPVSRSHSADCCTPDSDTGLDSTLETTKKKVLLRRYSSQGIGALENIVRAVTPQPSSTNTLPTQRLPLPPNHISRILPNFIPATKCEPFPLPTQFPTPSYPTPTFMPSFETPPRTPLGCTPRSTSYESTSSTKQPTFAPELLATPGKLSSDELRGRAVTYKGTNGVETKKHIFPRCTCIPGSDGLEELPPYYTHIGASHSIQGIRKLFEERCGFTGRALRIEKVCYTGKEGKTSRGCPIAKWVLRRSSEQEKIMVVCRQRPGHRCITAVMVVVIMLWEGVSRPLADFSYNKCTQLIPTNGTATERRCGTNEERTCACQGFDPEKGGASYSFGCSWSMYYNGCKFARSTKPNKFKLNGTKDSNAESCVADFCQRLASAMSVLYKTAAPDAHMNQIERECEGQECRLGYNPPNEGRPFSGVTCCMDFCAHAHKDQHNMENGTTLVLTLTKPELRVIGQKPPDEQLHVLPLYKLDLTNEEGTFEGVGQKIREGSIEILNGFRRQVRLRDKPVGTCKQRKQKRTKDGLDVSPVKKKRGRKPKRSLSMENLTSLPAMATTQQWNNQQWSISPSGLKIPPSPQKFDPSTFKDPILSPPPRWPYRRHVTQSDDSNLPSIGSFFSPNAHGAKTPQNQSVSPAIFGTPPVTPQAPSPAPSFQFGRRLSSTSPSIGNFQLNSPQNTALNPAFRAPSPATYTGKMPHGHPTPLPSLDTVMHHPFHQTFATVKSEPSTDQVAYYPQQENKINLKSYAAVKTEAGSAFPTQSYPQHPQQPPNLQFQQPQPPYPTPLPRRDVYSDSEESFMDQDIGGVAIAPGHGSVLIECAKRELHATTSLLYPNRFQPSRVSMVFYQHKSMNCRNHGAAEYGLKEAKRNQVKAEKAQKEKEEREEKERRDEEEKQRVINEAESLIARLNPHYKAPNPQPSTLPQHHPYQYPDGYPQMPQVKQRWPNPPPVSRTFPIEGELPRVMTSPRNMPRLMTSPTNQAPHPTGGIPTSSPYPIPQYCHPTPQRTVANYPESTTPHYTPSYHPTQSPRTLPPFYNNNPHQPPNPPSYSQSTYTTPHFKPPSYPTSHQYPHTQNPNPTYKTYPQQPHPQAPYQIPSPGVPQRPPLYYQYNYPG
nr:uncharacterized protein LOC100181878 [Ciona intestinalis]|eukprot:XP_002125458.3 uncharacterized protein LOC100181878 [Ciona intestinalis]